MSDKEAVLAFEAWWSKSRKGVVPTIFNMKAFEAGASWALDRAAKRIAEVTEERDKARRYCSISAYDMFCLAETLATNPEAFPHTTKGLMETSLFMSLAANGREDGTIYEDELSKAKKRIEALEAALREFANPTNREAVEGAPPSKIMRARAVLSQEKQHD